MDEETMRRLGANESAFRKVNESLRSSKTLADSRELHPFRCECGVLGCNQLLELTLPEYESVRENAARFVIVEGHEIPEAERVVQRAERYSVVEKFAAGAQVAIDADPRA